MFVGDFIIHMIISPMVICPTVIQRPILAPNLPLILVPNLPQTKPNNILPTLQPQKLIILAFMQRLHPTKINQLQKSIQFDLRKPNIVIFDEVY